jgi:hypothetical protein
MDLKLLDLRAEAFMLGAQVVERGLALDILLVAPHALDHEPAHQAHAERAGEYGDRYEDTLHVMLLRLFYEAL